MIGYSDATVPSSNHAVNGLIKFFRVPSAAVLELVFKLILFNTVISGQSFLVVSGATNQTGPLSP